MFPRSVLFLACFCSSAVAAVRSGHAEADWISSSTTYAAGSAVHTVVRLSIDPEWHTYWINPGEGGMKTSVKWELPEGWAATELAHPVPKRFMTGELHGFGYEGIVMFPVRITPPAGAAGKVKLRGSVSWLSCNDDKCVPGKAELELVLSDGKVMPTSEATLIEEAQRKVPQPASGYSLTIVEKEETLLLTLGLPTGSEINLADLECFPVTPRVIDSAARFEFVQDSGSWRTEVPKSEYLGSPLPALTLLFASKDRQSSWTVSSRSEALP